MRNTSLYSGGLDNISFQPWYIPVFHMWLKKNEEEKGGGLFYILRASHGRWHFAPLHPPNRGIWGQKGRKEEFEIIWVWIIVWTWWHFQPNHIIFNQPNLQVCRSLTSTITVGYIMPRMGKGGGVWRHFYGPVIPHIWATTPATTTSTLYSSPIFHNHQASSVFAICWPNFASY